MQKAEVKPEPESSGTEVVESHVPEPEIVRKDKAVNSMEYVFQGTLATDGDEAIARALEVIEKLKDVVQELEMRNYKLEVNQSQAKKYLEN